MTRIQPARVSSRPPALTRRVVGTPAEVAATVALVRDSGRLLSMTQPRQIPGSDRVTVTVRFLDTPGPAPAAVRRLRRGHVIAAVTVPALGALAGIGYLAVQLVDYLAVQLVDAVRTAFPAIAGVVLVLVVLAALLRGKSGCGGIHCSGCKH
ncbi:hypothetical protein SAMN05444365_102287 [Micromonospora pattaloongensis]|uniref:Uncharacterized protein n=1 Tax=Micromonospora pattaloongensis TaxID=405436 RepID=A0A1H3JYE7_9ACTN|nr:hypothetical protein [Micromonospora pattaloongensis]SDY44649.1 hypothetical protein SAMN05444365_102287 [Micromonospora pattaloongensis]